MKPLMTGRILSILILLGYCALTVQADTSNTLRPTTVDLRTAALLLSGQEGGELPLAAFAYPPPLAPESGLVVQIDLDGTALLERLQSEEPGTGRALEIDVFLYALDEELAVRAQSSQRFTLTADALASEDLQGVRFCHFLQLAPGEVDLRLLVTLEDRPFFGLRRLQQRVPNPQASQDHLPPPLLEESDRWLVVTASETRQALKTLLPLPWSIDPPTKLPASRPLLLTGTSIDAHLWKSIATGNQNLPIAQFRPTDGMQEITKVATSASTNPDGKLFQVSLAVPRAEPGFYNLSFHWANSLSTAPVTVFVSGNAAPTDIGASDPTSTSSSSKSTVVESQADLESGKKALLAISRPEMEALDRDYLQILQGFSSDPSRSDMAVEELRSFQVAALKRFDDAALAALEQVEKRFSNKFKRPDFSAVWPILWLHSELVRTHRQSDDFVLALHATQSTIRLAESYAHALEDEAAKSRASLLLVELAAFFQQQGPLARATKLYQRALDISPRQEEALLGIAVLEEKQGRHHATLEPLKTLIQHHPAHHEGRLRLAINLARVDRVEAARKHFRHLIEKRNTLPEWIAVLTFQERARMELRAGQTSSARRTLLAGLEHWPKERGLQLQLGAMLRSQNSPEADQWLAAALAQEPPEGVTPRARYNLWSRPPSDIRNQILSEKNLRIDDLAGLLNRLFPSELLP